MQLRAPVAAARRWRRAGGLLHGLIPCRSADSNTLAPPESFASIADAEARSAAIFTELGKVLTHPRCLNCHPAGDRPRQGDEGRPHQPPVRARRRRAWAVDAMRCTICHQKANFEPGRMPGHSGVAPRAARDGLAGQDARRDLRADQGPRAQRRPKSFADLIHHIGDDTLVGWAWEPGFGRTPAPGTQAEAGALVEAWVKTGAACPAK